MPFYMRQAPPKNVTRREETESTDNFEPLIEPSNGEDKIEIAETPDFGLSVEVLSLHCEPTDSSSPTTPHIQEIRISALDVPNHPDRKDGAFGKKGVNGVSVAVHELEQGKSWHKYPKRHPASTLIKMQRNQAVNLWSSNKVVSPVSKTVYTGTSTHKLSCTCLTSDHGFGLSPGRNTSSS